MCTESEENYSVGDPNAKLSNIPTNNDELTFKPINTIREWETFNSLKRFSVAVLMPFGTERSNKCSANIP